MNRLALAIVLAVSALGGHALAQSFPERTITLVNPYAAGGPADLLARTIADGKMPFARVGVASLPQFLGVLLQQRANLTLVPVPYKGAAPASVDLLAGRVDLAFLNVPPGLPPIPAGTLR